MKQFLKKKEDVLSELEVSTELGLTDSQVEKSREKYGENKFSEGKKVSLFEKVVEALKEPMTLILVFAAFIALGVNVITSMRGGHADFIEVVGIFFAIALSVVITIVMEGKSEQAFEELNKIKDDITVRVIRNGEVKLIAQHELVVGDIYHIETGDKIAADGRLLSSNSLRVNESALTGESKSVKKNENAEITDTKTPVAERYNMVYSGCFVESGSGSIVITEVGDATEFGNIAKELSGVDKGSTPIQEKLGKLGQTIAILGAIVSLAVFLIQLFNLVNSGAATFETVSAAFINSIVLIVAAVPEGLPTIVAISLSLNVVKLAKQNALVRKLVASETVGSINIICSDKTGTLTENKMTLTGVYEYDDIVNPGEITNEYLVNNFAVNSTANINLENKENAFIGNPTECAILYGYEQDCKKSYKDIRNEAKTAYVYPFASETKNMTTVVSESREKVVYTKGSPEKIIELCDKVMINGEEAVLTAEIKTDIERKITSYQEKANRVLAFAHKKSSVDFDYENDRGQVELEMVYDGFVTITDPLREDVYEAVAKCHNAGIEVKMLTGDNIVTATAISEELGIIGEDKKVVQARDIEDLPEDEFNKILPEISVIARSTPLVKMRVVKTLKNQGNVVAVTGDGINDAPAIKNADVGIAMGISGTEVSKEASDIVLIDDSFATIVNAVKWGRGVYDNFKRFIQFQLSVNLSSVVVVLCSIIAGFASPFSALELLWINLIMDGPPALTLGLEPVRDDMLDRKPTKRDENIITKDMMRTIVFNGLFITVLFMVQLFKNPLGATPEQASTVLFTMFVVCNLFNAFNAREIGNGSILRNITNNKMMLLVFGLTFLLQVAITQFGAVIFKTVPLPLEMWGKIMIVGLSVIAASEIFRFLNRQLSREK